MKTFSNLSSTANWWLIFNYSAHIAYLTTANKATYKDKLVVYHKLVIFILTYYT